MPVILAEALHLRTPDHQLDSSPAKLVFADCTRRINIIEHVVLLLEPTVMILLDLLLVVLAVHIFYFGLVVDLGGL